MNDAFPGKLREYCLRFSSGAIYGPDRIWARNLFDAATRYNPSVLRMQGLHVSSVRTVAEETEETLRDT